MYTRTWFEIVHKARARTYYAGGCKQVDAYPQPKLNHCSLYQIFQAIILQQEGPGIEI